MTIADDVKRENAELRALNERLLGERDKLSEEIRELKSKLAAAEGEEGGADGGRFCASCGDEIYLDERATAAAEHLLSICERPIGTLDFRLPDSPEARRSLLALNDAIGHKL